MTNLTSRKKGRQHQKTVMNSTQKKEKSLATFKVRKKSKSKSSSPGEDGRVLLSSAIITLERIKVPDGGGWERTVPGVSIETVHVLTLESNVQYINCQR